MARHQRNTNIYEYDHNAVRVAVPAPVRQPERVPQRVIRPRETVHTRPVPKKRRRISILFVLVMIIGALVLGNIITMHSEMTELSLKSHALKKEIENMEKEQSTLKYELNNQLTAQELDVYAREQLGMKKTDANDMVFLKYAQEDSFEIDDTSQKTSGAFGFIFDGIKDFAVSVWEYIN